MLSKKQQKLYDDFYESTHDNRFLDDKTELLIGLAAAIAMNCEPCTAYYLRKLKSGKCEKGAIQETIAKVMAVAAGQKKLQTQKALHDFKMDLDHFQA
ncbi:MAG: carboxymuconolactone decarboxylase family protein [Pseudomonadota bacterium]